MKISTKIFEKSKLIFLIKFRRKIFLKCSEIRNLEDLHSKSFCELIRITFEDLRKIFIKNRSKFNSQPPLLEINLLQ
jgi:hypothetical protein